MVLLTQTFLLIPTFLLFVFANVTLGAPTLFIEGGQLAGARNVIVSDDSGTTIASYDVRFQDGSCVGLFNGCDDSSDFTFAGDNSRLASFASRALLRDVFLDGSDGSFDTVPSLTVGCESGTSCRVFTPYLGDDCTFPSERVGISGAGNRANESQDVIITSFGIGTCNLDFKDLPDATYAKWVLHQKPDFSFKDDAEAKRTVITQAVYGTKKLVKDRKARILATVLSDILAVPFSGPVKVTAEFGGKLIGTLIKEFNGEEDRLYEFPFTPQDEGPNQDLVLRVDPLDPNNPNDKIGQIDESDERNNEFKIEGFEVVDTKNLEIAYLGITGCINHNELCFQGSLKNFDEHITESTAFLETVFPLKEGGVASLKANLFGGNSTAGIGSTIYKDYRDISEDLMRLERFKVEIDNFAGAHRIIGVVPEDYFEFRGVCCTTENGKKLCAGGVKWPGIDRGILSTEGLWTTDAHELAHTFKLDDEYAPKNAVPACIAPTSLGIETDGYWIDGPSFAQRNVNEKLGFMGTSPGKRQGLSGGGLGTFGEPARWVTKENWETLTIELQKSLPDPPMILIQLVFLKDGSVETRPWTSFMGTPEEAGTGPYRIELLDHTGLTILIENFNLTFEANLEEFGILSLNQAAFSKRLSYPKEIAMVKIIGPNEDILFSADPVIKILEDKVDAISDQCFISSGNNDRENLLDHLTQITDLLVSANVVAAITKLEETRSFVENSLVNECEIGAPLATSKEKMLMVIDDSIERLKTRIGDVPPDIPGDLDGDGDIDTDDFQLFQSTFGKCEGQAGYIPKANFDDDTCITFVDYQTWYGLFTAQE